MSINITNHFVSYRSIVNSGLSCYVIKSKYHPNYSNLNTGSQWHQDWAEGALFVFISAGKIVLKIML